jgi:hypothetical protein
MAAGASGWVTMNPSVPTTVAGDPATRWHRTVAVTIVQAVVVATQLRMLTDPRPHPTRCRRLCLARVLVARDRKNVEVCLGHGPKPGAEPGGGEQRGRQVVSGALVVAGCNAPELPELVEAVLGQIALAIERRGDRLPAPAIGLGWDKTFTLSRPPKRRSLCRQSACARRRQGLAARNAWRRRGQAPATCAGSNSEICRQPAPHV